LVGKAVAVALGLLTTLIAVPVSAQPPTTPTEPTPTTTPSPTPAGGPSQPPVLGTDVGIQIPGVLFPPLTGIDPLYPAPVQGPLTLTPSITIEEEYNDNVFLDNNDKRSDFITRISPGLALAMQQPGFNLTASYAFSGEIYAKESQLNEIANSHRFLASLSYQATPRVGLSLSDGFVYSKNSNAASVAGVSTGRQTSLSNVLAAGLNFQATQRLTWNASAAYTIQRFDAASTQDSSQRFGATGTQDSDTYHIGTGLSYAVTPRMDLTAGYDVEYFVIDREKPSTTHTPRIGAAYRFTPTLTASVSGGPSFLVSDGDTTVTPAGSATVAKTTSWGAMSGFYDRSISTAGGLGGPSDVQTVGGSVVVGTYLRGLVVSFNPRYTMTKSEGSSRSKSDVKALSLNLSASYQLARYVAVVASYTFFHQTTDSADGRAADADQNRISVGLRFGYPISVY